jgi:phospholipase/carboxylesterase
MPAVVSRRRFFALAAALAGLLLDGCDGGRRVTNSLPGIASNPDGSNGRLIARPTSDRPARVRPGPRLLGIRKNRDALLSIPPEAQRGTPVPLLVSLHGAGGGSDGIGRFRAAADLGVAMLVPRSRGPTWDLALGGFGVDVDVIDEALARTFEEVVVDPRRIVLAGFSDGASYALSLGPTNGDLFPFVIACSPGFFAPAELGSRPRIFVSHGTEDRVLPIDASSRRIVPGLRDRGYEVRFVEFEGSHEVPPEIARRAVDWFLRVSRVSDAASR